MSQAQMAMATRLRASSLRWMLATWFLAVPRVMNSSARGAHHQGDQHHEGNLADHRAEECDLLDCLGLARGVQRGGPEGNDCPVLIELACDFARRILPEQSFRVCRRLIQKSETHSLPCSVTATVKECIHAGIRQSRTSGAKGNNRHHRLENRWCGDRRMW